MTEIFEMPWMPPAEIVRIEGRGEFFVRRHIHPDPTAPTVMLLHGWTASADLQFFSAYPALAERASFIGIDHRGHGRGPRTLSTFDLDVVADDHVAVARRLGIDRAVLVGYSMGGPIGLSIAHRHREFVAGIIVQATALDWAANRFERWRWRLLPLLASMLRSRWYPTFLRSGLPRMVTPGHDLEPYLGWLEAEAQRGSAMTITQAGWALSRFDAGPWVGSIDAPAGALITTRDHLVPPRKQRQLAAALGATRREMVADHGAPWEQPGQFASLTVELLDDVIARSADTASGDTASAVSSAT